jgi:hypothetical protein
MSSQADALNMRLVGQTDLNGHGDCMHVNVKDGFAFVAHMGESRVGTSVVDVSAPRHPRVVAQHTALPIPGRDVLVVTDEQLANDCQGMQTRVRVVDIADETQPRVIAEFPVPVGDFCSRGGRFGPHKVHEMRPGSLGRRQHHLCDVVQRRPPSNRHHGCAHAARGRLFRTRSAPRPVPASSSTTSWSPPTA